MAETEKASKSKSVANLDKPKILLMDLPENVEAALKAEGYNVSAGTFGRPYNVEMTGGYSRLLAAGDLPNYTEQEIIFIDQSVPDATDNPEGELHTSVDQLSWWVQHTQAVVDPRPHLMAMASKAFDRTLDHGGILVVFSMPRNANKFVWARKPQYHDLYIESELDFDNWSFCSMFKKDEMLISPDNGRELVPDETQNPVSEFFRRHAAQMTYYATFEPRYYLSDNCDGFTFYPLIRTKFGPAAGGVICDPKRKGWIFVLPQCSSHQKEYVIVDLLQNVLTEVGRHLFPHLEGGRWVQQNEYEHNLVLQLKAEQDHIRTDAQSKVAAIDEQIAHQREKLDYFHGILTKKSTPLVKDVKMALEKLGFTQVIDADEQQDKDASMQEDLQILDDSPALLVEVKGVISLPA